VPRAASTDSGAPPLQPRADRATWLALAALTVLGAALRLHGLALQSLWNDELSSVAEFSQRGFLKLLGARTPPDHVPGYWMGMYVWSRVIGDSEALLRLPSALFGIAAIPAMFALGRRLYGNAEGLIAGGITAVAWLTVWYSQEARPYALLLASVVWSAAFLIDLVRALRSGIAPRRATLVAYVIAAGAAANAHYFGVMTVCVEAATAAVLLRRRPRALAMLAAVYGAVLLLAAASVFHGIVVPAIGPGWLTPPAPADLWRLFLFFFNWSDGIAAIVLAIWALALGRSLVRRARPTPATLMLVAWLVAPVAFVYAYSHLVAPRFLNRTLIVVAPAAYLLLARALTQLPLVRVTGPALLAMLLFHLVVPLQFYARPVKEQFREAAAYLVAHDGPDHDTLVLACAGNRNYFDYYLAHMGSTRRVESRLVTDTEMAAALALVAERQPRDLWLLSAHRTCDESFLAALASRMTLVDEHVLRHAIVRRYQRK